MSRRRSASRWNLLPAPPDWTNGRLVLYHGTVDLRVNEVLRRVDVRRGRPDTDFGRGFYATTSLPAAQAWANDTARRFLLRKANPRPAVIRFEVDRERLVGLEALCFVRGDGGADD